MLSISARLWARLVLLVAIGIAASPLTAQERCAVVHKSDYFARFDSDSMVFVPKPSDTARHAWRFRLIAAERTSNRLTDPLPAPTQSVDTTRVSYARPGLVERYDVRQNGIEQSFVFETLPAGKGDLVVRGRITTELVADAAGVPAHELHFGAPDGVGVRVGAVTGIDATGRTTPGVMRLLGDQLELVLPAAFVDEAALPLVLDPLIGPLSSPSVAGAADTNPDVAYDETNDVFLVVFGRNNPAFPSEVSGVLMRPDGSVVGTPFRIGDGEEPKVGNVGSRDKFVVVYRRARTRLTP